MTLPTLLALAALSWSSPAAAAPPGGGGCLSKPSRDCDADGLVNSVESTLGTSPSDADTDDDGLSDGAEHLTWGTAPTDADTDDDALSDGAEALTWGSDPFDADTDDDYLDDGGEVATYGGSPTDADTDGDGFADNYEAWYGGDPQDPDTDGDGALDGDDAFLDDPAEWVDHDGDDLGDNADTVNIVDDLDEVVGGASLASGALPVGIDYVYCPDDLTGPIEASNPNCEVYVGYFTLSADGTTENGNWDEWLDANGVWNFRLGVPELPAASIRLVGPRVTPRAGYTTCYEGEVQNAGGGYVVSWGIEYSYYFQTGRFSACIE